MFQFIAEDSSVRTFPTGEEAMQAFAAAGFKGKIVPPSEGAPAPTPADGKTVSAEAQKRIARHEDMLAKKGIALPPPLFTPGTRVVAYGEERFRTLRAQWDEQADVVDALRDVLKVVRAEERHDKVVAVRDITMGDDGRIDWGEGWIPFEANGLTQFIQRNNQLFPHGSRYLSAIRPGERAWNINRRIAGAGTGYDKTVVFRVRYLDGKPQVFATVSEGYAPFDADKVVTVLGKSLKDSGMKGEVIYDPATTNLRVLGTYHADKVLDLAAGDVFKVGVQFSANDAGSGSIKGDAVAWRNLCLNLLIIGTGKKALISRVHRGAVADIEIDMKAAAAEASVIFEDFASEWNVLRAAKAADVFKGETKADWFAELAAMKEVDAPVKRDTMVELLLKTWAEEPGDSVADIVNAVTRTHMLDEITQYNRERLERSAGRLVPVLARRVSA